MLFKKPLFILFLLFFSFAGKVYATNGNQLIAYNVPSLLMGGVSIATSSGAVSAVMANPAMLGAMPCREKTIIEIGTIVGTLDSEVAITLGGVTYKGKSDNDEKVVPSVAYIWPSTDNCYTRFGLASAGIAGLGVDFTDSALDRPGHYDFGLGGKFPLLKGLESDMEILRTALASSIEVRDDFYLGFALHVDRAELNLGESTRGDETFSLQTGIYNRINDFFSYGITYMPKRGFSFNKVVDANGDGLLDNLKLELPQEAGLGIALSFNEGRFVAGLDVKWKNWSEAKGYKEFDWKDQNVFALGFRYNATAKLSILAGFNYAEQPIKKHDNFTGTKPVDLQGKILPAYYYETFRLSANPAIEEKHLSLGFDYNLNNFLSLTGGYTHIFKEDFKEKGTDITGAPVQIEISSGSKAYSLSLNILF